MTANLKLAGSGLHECPEVEQLRPCEFFGAGKCPSCYALPLLTLRRRNSRHVHKSTERGGLVRLGTYREVGPRDWAAFKAGEGAWDCCGERWSRPDFRSRPYFIVTRGLASFGFYQLVAADPAAVNIQVSTDVLPSGEVVPPREVLAQLATLPKVIFRAKTTPANVGAFLALWEGLSIPRSRIMETPLRVSGERHVYGQATPLETAGWAPKTFLRCNSTCANCPKENGLLACAARPRALLTLADRPRPDPPRPERVDVALGVPEVRRALAELGGEASTRQLYAYFLDRYPTLAEVRPNWQFRVRVAVQQVARSTPAPRLEVFARFHRQGWDTWGSVAFKAAQGTLDAVPEAPSVIAL